MPSSRAQLLHCCLESEHAGLHCPGDDSGRCFLATVYAFLYTANHSGLSTARMFCESHSFIYLRCRRVVVYRAPLRLFGFAAAVVADFGLLKEKANDVLRRPADSPHLKSLG